MSPKQLEELKSLITDYEQIIADQLILGDPKTKVLLLTSEGKSIHVTEEERVMVINSRLAKVEQGLEITEKAMSEIFGSPLV